VSLIQTIEEFDPGHFARREDILEDLREKARTLGFFPLPLTRNDIECFWVRIESKTQGKNIPLSRETLDDALSLPTFMRTLKDAAKYEI
jgi:hypothetical protein